MEQVARDYPRNFVVYQHMARTYKTQGNWKKAAETYELMVSRFHSGDSGYQALPVAKTLYLAGEAYAKVGDTARAQQLFAEAEKRTDDSIFVYRAALAAGGVDQQQNRLAEARRRFQRVASAVPATDEGRAARQYLKKLQ
jgi:tetratricopeptide (TPR) repeat protein